MSLPRFAMRRPVVVWTVVTLLFGLGVYQFLTMPRRADPEFTIRIAQVLTQWPGVEAERVERLVTRPLEEEISSIAEVDFVRSTTRTGQSVIYVELPDALPVSRIQETWERVRGRVELVRPSLPAGVRDPVVNDDFGDTAIMLIAISERGSGERYEPRDLEEIADRVRERLALMEGVARAELHGVRQERVYIEADAAAWATVGLSIDELAGLLEARNIRTAGGSVDSGETRVGFQPTGEFDAIGEISSVVVGVGPDGTPVTLQDAGFTVRRDYQDPPSFLVRTGDAESDRPSIVCAVIMQDGHKVTQLGPEIRAALGRMSEIERVIPEDVSVEVVYDESVFVAAKISDFVVNVLQAVAIVVGVALVMAGFRSALVMAAAIPFVMIISIGLSALTGTQLEQMSIASLIIALGMLVDNAVVVCDNSRRLMEEGLPRRKAVIEGVEQIMFPTLMGTLTTVAAFAPLGLFLTGSRQEYVLSIPVVVSITLLTSWVLGMTLTTLMAFYLIRPKSTEASAWSRLRARLGVPAKQQGGGLSAIYGRLVRVSLAAKAVPLATFVALLVGAGMLPVGSEFFPDDRRDYCYVDVWLPEGASLEATERKTREVEALLRELSPVEGDDGLPTERLKQFYTSVGGSGPRFALGVGPTPPAANFAQIVIQTTDADATSQFVEELRVAALERITGARVIPTKLALGPAGEAPISLRVYARGFTDPGFGDEWTLRRVSSRFGDVLRDVPGLWDETHTWGEPGFQLDIRVDETQANLAGVTNASIAQTLSAYFSGQRLTTFREGDRLIPVEFRLPPEERRPGGETGVLYVEGANGKVPLDAVASLDFKRVSTKIERREQNRVIAVEARVEPGYLANERLAAARDDIDAIRSDLPPGVWMEYGGTLEDSKESAGEMGMAFGAGLLLIVLVLVVQYNSVIKPLIVLTTAPMGAIGALFGLWVTGHAMGFMPLLGLVSLVGIVVNSAILYLEFADAKIAAKRNDASALAPAGERSVSGLSRAAFREALAEAGEQRLPAIVLTVSTTVGGLIPLALFGGPLWEGMAYLLIFGLLVATVMTLVVLPALYAAVVEWLGMDPVPVEQDD